MSFFLAWAIAFPLPPRAEARAVAPVVPLQAALQSEAPLRQAARETTVDPLTEMLQQLPELPLDIALRADDPLLDADPFFLRAQHWVDVEADDDFALPAGTAGYRAVSGGHDIRLAGSSRAFRLSLPMHPVGEAGEYLWFAADHGRFFDEDEHRGESGEGLFVLALDDLAAAEARGDRVPLFFFPLPEAPWSGATVQVVEAPAGGLAVLRDGDSETLPVRLDDVDTIVDAARLNLLMATGHAARAAALAGVAVTANSGFLPLPKSTAGFGLLFTGFDVASPDRSLFHAPVAGRVPHQLHRLWARFGHMVLPEAVADGGVDPTAKLVNSLLRLGTVCAITLAAAVVLRYTVFREKFRQRALKEDAENPGRQHGVWRTVKRHLRGITDVFAHNLTLISQFPKVWFGSGVRYIVDRYFPQLGSGKNRRLFKLLNATVYFTESAGKKLPVNYRTLILGTFVLGGIDSVFVGLQLYFAVPWIAQAIAATFPSTQARVDEVFQLGNPATETYARNDTVRNAASYLSGGATAFSGPLRQQLLTVVGPAVDEELKKLGIDPLDANVRERRDALIEERMEALFKQVGLPGKEEFLFDASTVVQAGLRQLGLALPGDQNAGYLASYRPGIVVPAYKKAYKLTLERLRENPNDPALLGAKKLFEHILGHASLVQRYVGTPLATLARWVTGRGAKEPLELSRSSRQLKLWGFALSYEGPVSEGLRNLPSEFVQAVGEPSARVAGYLYRRALYGYLEGSPEITHGPSDERWRSLPPDKRAELETRARAELTKNYPSEEVAPSQTIADTHGAEYALLLEDMVREELRFRDEDATPLKKPYEGWRHWFERRQIRAAKRKALARYRAIHRTPYDFDSATAEQAKAYARHYRDAYLEGVAIHPSFQGFEDQEQKIAEKAERLTQSQVEERKMKEYLASLDAEKRTDLQLTFYAENWAASYLETMTTTVDEIAQRRFQERFGRPYMGALTFLEVTAERWAATHGGAQYDDDTASRALRKQWKALQKSVAKELGGAWNEIYGDVSLSPAQPGRFQWLRKKEAVQSRRWLTRAIRSVEAMFPEEAHRGGFWNMAYRNVLLAPFPGFGLADVKNAWEVTLRAIPTSGLASYWAYYLLWGTGLPLNMWLLAQMARFTVEGPWFFLNRFCRMQGMQPMSSTRNMAQYAVLGSLITFTGAFPLLWYEQDFKAMLDKVGTSVSDLAKGAQDLVGGCATRLAGKQ